MCKIENRRIVLVEFQLIFKEEWVGNAMCSYEYDTERVDFNNLLRIDLDISFPLKKINPTNYKWFESEIECFESPSQAFDLVNNYLKKEYFGTEIILVKTIFEFTYLSKKDNVIRLTLLGPNMAPYEMASQTNGRYMALSDMNEEQAIRLGYENLN